MIRRIIIFTLLVLLTLMGEWSNSFAASKYFISIEATPQTVDIKDLSIITVKVKKDDKPLTGVEVFLGLNDIDGDLGSAVIITDQNGVAKTTFKPQNIGDGYILARSPVREGASVQTLQAITAISVKNLNRRPEAYIDSVHPLPGRLGEPVTFTGHGLDPDGSLVSYIWSFGDGTSVKGEGSRSTVQHIFLKTGTFTVTLNYIDNRGEFSDPPSVILHVIDNKPPSASMAKPWPSTGKIDEEIEIHIRAFDIEGALSSALVAWGDGTEEKVFLIGSEANFVVKHTYKKGGDYIITCLVFDDKGEGPLFPPEGQKIIIEGVGLGGLKVNVPDISDKILQVLGPLPRIDVVYEGYLTVDGFETGLVLLSGKYLLVAKDRSFGLRGFQSPIEIQSDQIIHISAKSWIPHSQTMLILKGNENPVIRIEILDDEGPVRKRGSCIIDVIGGSSNQNITIDENGVTEFTISPEPSSKSITVTYKAQIDEVIIQGKRTVDLTQPLPRIKITAQPVTSGILVSIDNPRISSKGELLIGCKVIDRMSGREVNPNDILMPPPEHIRTSFWPLRLFIQINANISSLYRVELSAKFEFEQSTVSFDKIIFYPCLRLARLDSILAYTSKDKVFLRTSLNNVDQDYMYPNQRFDLAFDFAAPIGYVPPDVKPTGLPTSIYADSNGIASTVLDVTAAVVGYSVEGLKMIIKTTLGGLTFTTESRIKIVYSVPSINIFNTKNGTLANITLKAADENGKPSSGVWANIDYIKDGRLLRCKDLKEIGNPPIAIRTSSHGECKMNLTVPVGSSVIILFIVTIQGFTVASELKIDK